MEVNGHDETTGEEIDRDYELIRDEKMMLNAALEAEEWKH